MSAHKRNLKIATDPRALADYGALRDELSKLTHPARPDVDWQRVQALCLSLFNSNGVELQSASWYTLAKAHSTGLAGLNEGLAILENLISYHWEEIWPHSVQVKIEILSRLSRQLQQILRRLTFCKDDLALLRQTQTLLKPIDQFLQHLELCNSALITPLHQMVHSTIIWLENSDEAVSKSASQQESSDIQQKNVAPSRPNIENSRSARLLVSEVIAQPKAIAKPAVVVTPRISAKMEFTVKPRVTAKPELVVKPEVTAKSEPTVKPGISAKMEFAAKPRATAKPEAIIKPEVTTKPEFIKKPEVIEKSKDSSKPRIGLSSLKAFFAGVMLTLLLGGLSLWVTKQILADSDKKQLMASVAPLPAAISVAKADSLHKTSPSWLVDNQIYQQRVLERLQQLNKLPSYWPLQYGYQLVEQTKHLYPESVLAQQIMTHWRKGIMENALPQAKLHGWQKGMIGLQSLQERLNQLDEKRGKYITVSELKSAVFSIITAFNESVPAEEQLRLLQSAFSEPQNFATLAKQVEMQLNQLNASYILITTP